MTYIDREKALSICQKYYLHCLEMHDFSGDSIADDIQTDIQNLPTADVVEIVHCKNCKHLMFSDCYGECKKGYMGIVSPDDYCSRGERKD